MTRKGYIVMPGYEYEGLTAHEQPYRVYWTRKAAERRVENWSGGPYGKDYGDYAEVVEVEVNV